MNEYQAPRIIDDALIEDESTISRFIANVFSWMVAGLVMTASAAYYVAQSGLVTKLYNLETGGMSGLGWVVMLAPLGFIVAMNMGFQRWSSMSLTLLFLAFSAIMGVSLSSIFLVYSASSISQVFVITAVTFGIMAVVGYTTKTDLTKFGSLLMMALIGIIIASFVNWFIGSAGLDYIISIGGVLIFTGLIAYDTQRLKRIAAGVEYGSETGTKLAILGATSLYLNFINLFLFLLRLLGRRN
ncbi:MAG: Bax inhibitor-1/YccA family protein [Flavobacteriales bacterium]|nr:Bax inhibitor-1/YccA family protein [Flavobacteriales bacterium]